MNRPNVNVSVSGPVLAPNKYKTIVLKGGIPFGDQIGDEYTKYVIKWDFDLGGQTVTVPENCILEFDGGSLKNGTIVGQDTLFINVGDVDIWGDNLTRLGTWREYSGAGGGGIPDKEYDPEHHSGLGRKTLELKGDNNILMQEDFDQDNTIYVFAYDFVLGEDITVPANCVLNFDGGSISNTAGNEFVLGGTGTQIRADKTAIFTNMKIGGTWNVPEITSAWFSDATENNVLKQTFNLTNEAVHNVVTIEDGTYNVSCLAEKEAPINIDSNTDVNLIGRIKLAPNSLYSGFAVNIVYGAKNINVYGNGVIEGDKFKHDYQTGALALGNKILSTNASNTPKGIVLYTGNEQITGTLEVSESSADSVYWVRNKFNDSLDPSGETGYVTTNYTYYQVVSGKWKAVNTCESCHGLNIHECYNVSISNITIEKCAGDCIYIGYRTLPANKVSLSNLTLDNGRRQGLSVTSAENLLIDNCYISNINGTSPQAGIDIEPNANSVITNFVIRNTTIKNVGGAGIAMHNTKINGLDNVAVENVIIDGCVYGIGSKKTDIHGLSIKNVTVTNNSSYGIVLQPYENIQVEEPEPYNVRDSIIENFMCDARHDNVDSWTNIIMGINISVNNCTFNGQTLVRSYLYTDASHEERGITVSNCTFNAISEEESLANSSQTVRIHNACSIIGGTIICKHLRLPNGCVSIRDAKIIVDTISSSVYSSDSPSGSRFNTIENCYLECPHVYLGYNCSLVGNTLVLWSLETGINSVIKSNVITFTGNGMNLPNGSNIKTSDYCDISFNRITANNGGRVQEHRDYPVRLGYYNSFRHNVYTLTQAFDEQNNPITTELAAFLFIADYDDVSFNKFVISGTNTFVWRLFYVSTTRKSAAVLFSNTYNYDPALVEGEGFITNYCAYRDASKNRLGTSEERPELTSLDVSFEYYDTTLGKPIYWNGEYWADTSGQRVTWTITYVLYDVTASNMTQPTTGEQYTTIITPNEGFALPSTITVKIDGVTRVAGTDYTYNDQTGEIVILGIGGTGGVTGDVSISVAGVA